MNATYFREYGMHPVKQPGGQDYIASFPNWDEAIQTLKTDFPSDGNVVTPEYITMPDNLLDAHDATSLIDERIHAAAELTKHSDATLHLGTPTWRHDKNDEIKWYNSVLSLRRGKLASITHKTSLLPVEKRLGISEPARDLRTMKNGNAVLICAELFLYALDPKNALQGKNVRQIFAPTMWATPVVEGQNHSDIEKAGSEDAYYRQQLERAVGSYLLRNMPTVQRVIISDRGRPNLSPYNVIYDRLQ